MMDSAKHLAKNMLRGAVVVTVASASGCGDGSDTNGSTETAGLQASSETVAQAGQALGTTPTECWSVRAGQSRDDILFKTYDTALGEEKKDNNNSLGTIALVAGPNSLGGGRFRSLFKFDLSFMPLDATVVSSGLALYQTNNGVATVNLHKVLVGWNEATVTWNSFHAVPSPFDPLVLASASNSPSATTRVFDVKALVQGWVSQTIPNNGVLLEHDAAPLVAGKPRQTQFRSRDFGTIAQRPSLSICFNVTCSPATADCDGKALNGCETNLNDPASCGACGVVCALPNAVAACPAGECTLSACNLGFADCDGDAANGCEASLTSNASCGACGVACALPNALSSCATGTCTAVSCNEGHYDCDGQGDNGCEALPCNPGQHCATGEQCSTFVCSGGFCATASCADGAKNGAETATDCGGGTCPACAADATCAVNGDCQSSVCQGGVCQSASCSDGTTNGVETDLDCGGTSCAPCADGKACLLGSDCASGVCLGGVCKAPTCTDGLKNGSEAGVDCGGSCGPCANGAACFVAADCASAVCTNDVCQIPSCGDAVKNGSETGVDCGGSCPPCNPNEGCNGPGDCGTGVCVGGFCQPATCTDGVKNGDETGADCGGACTVPEVCNGLDDDCNGSTDEGLGSTTCGIGACQVTVQSCVNGALQPCVPGAPAAVEDCEGNLDDDCDGAVDEGCDCVNGSTKTCYSGSAATEDVGVCHGGTQTCVLGHWGACVNEVTPSAESCDGLDNDCNGQLDDGLGQTVCGIGSCQVTTPNCVNGAPQTCTPQAPGTEICDGLDNDCNGIVNDAYAIGAQTWYADADGDTYGNAAVTTQACEQPLGYVSNDADCNDGDPSLYSSATGWCGGSGAAALVCSGATMSSTSFAAVMTLGDPRGAILSSSASYTLYGGIVGATQGP
jgi:hypothetical protein